MPLTAQDAWSAYAQAVLAQVGSGAFDPKTQAFSLAGQTLNVDLANADPTIINASVFGLGDVVPAAGGSYTVGASLISSYFSFLNWVKLKGDPNPNLQSQINIASGNLTNAQSNYITVQTNAVAAWNGYKAIDPTIGFTDYVRTQYPVYGQAKSALDASQAQYTQLMMQAYGPDYQTIVNAQNNAGFNGAQSLLPNALNMAVKWGSAAPAGSGPAVLPGQNPPSPASSLISTFAPGYTLQGGFTQNYQQWQSQSVQQPPVLSGLKINLTAATSAMNWSNAGWAAGMHATFGGFFAVEVAGQASYAEQKFDTASSNFSFEVSFLGSGLFPVVSNRWFDMSIVKNYQNSLRADHPDFFGQASGTLARVPTQVLIGFQPKVRMQVSASDYSSFKSQFQQSVNVSYRFGPFTIGSASESSYAQKSSVQFDDSSSSFSFGPVQSTVPQVIGVVSSKIG